MKFRGHIACGSPTNSSHSRDRWSRLSNGFSGKSSCLRRAKIRESGEYVVTNGEGASYFMTTCQPEPRWAVQVVANSPTKITMVHLLRCIAIIPLICGIALQIGNHHQGGMKGGALSIQNVLVCCAVAVVAAFICKRGWLWFAAPFVAGVFGALISGPYGGILGLLVGCVVTLLPFGHRPRYRPEPTTKIIANGEAHSGS